MQQSKIPGAKTLIMGGTGTGKTYSIRSYVDAGITPFVIFTEPGMETLSDTQPNDAVSRALKEGKHPYHWTYLPPVTSEWGALLTMAELVNKLSYEALCKMTDTNKQKYGQFLDVIRMCNNFKCDECEQSFGDITTWGTDRAVVLDSLTGISKMAMRLVVGGKVAKAPPDYGVAQETLMKLLDAWTTQCHCWFTITAHQSMEKDESTGMIKRMPNTVGRAISPEIPNFFSDVLESIRIGSEFYWDTASVGADVKARNVPIGSKLTPSFVPLVKRWKEKGGIIENVEG